MQLSRYLDRIGYTATPTVDWETLAGIHRHHLEAIPYENIDVQLERASTPSVADAFDKIVNQRRGGWCYEMNGLLGWALQEIGFDIKRVCGGVARTLRGDSAMGNHLVLITELDGQTYVVDVGFGDGFFEPIPLVTSTFAHRGFEFRLEDCADGYWRLHNHENGGAPDFDFTLEPADEALLARQCQMLQTSQESPFVMALICQLFVKDRYEIQLGRMARTVTSQGVETRLLDSPAELIDRLRDTFRLEVPEVTTLWPRIVERHEALFARE